MFSNDHPLWMPSGSVRSILAGAIVAGAMATIVPWDVAGIVIAFYFADRSSANNGT